MNTANSRNIVIDRLCWARKPGAPPRCSAPLRWSLRSRRWVACSPCLLISCCLPGAGAAKRGQAWGRPPYVRLVGRGPYGMVALVTPGRGAMGGHPVRHSTRPASSHRAPLRGRLSLTLLGGFELGCAGRSVTVPLSVERLLAFVALQNRPVNRCFASGTLWPETTDERAGANLRSALWRLRRISPSLVETSPTHLRLGSGTAVDAHLLSSSIWRILDP